MNLLPCDIRAAFHIAVENRLSLLLIRSIEKCIPHFVCFDNIVKLRPLDPRLMLPIFILKFLREKGTNTCSRHNFHFGFYVSNIS